MSSRTGRPLGEDGHRLLTFESARDGLRLFFGTFKVRSIDVNRAILVGKPVDQRMAKIVFRHERTAKRSAEQEDVEPARMIGEEQCMVA